MPQQNRSRLEKWLPGRSLRRRIVWFLSCLVVFTTTYALILPAITLANETYCQMEEHRHDESCYLSKKTLCNKEETEQTEHIHEDSCYDEDSQLICKNTESASTEFHRHSEECYQSEILLCNMKEHEHSKMCYSNLEDTEEKEDWEKTLPNKLEGTLPENVLEIARSQLGYRENDKNFILDDQDEKKNYSRYGEWYGSPYEDWNLMFLSFVLHYSEVPEIPYGEVWEDWKKDLKKNEIEILEPEILETGDIVLFHQRQDKESSETEPAKSNVAENRVGIVSHTDPVRIISGDWDGKVEELEAEKEKLVLDGLIPVREENAVEDKEDNQESAEETESSNEKKTDSDQTGESDSEKTEGALKNIAGGDKDSSDGILSDKIPEKIYETEDENFLFEVKVKETAEVKELKSKNQTSVSEELPEEVSVKESASKKNTVIANEVEKTESSLTEEEALFEKEALNLSEDGANKNEESESDDESDTNVQDQDPLIAVEVSGEESSVRKSDGTYENHVSYNLKFLSDGSEMNADDYSFEISVTPKSDYIQSQIEKMNEQNKSTNPEIVLFLEPDDKTDSQLVELNSESLNEAEYRVDGEIETLNIESNIPSFMLRVSESPNPQFEVQIYGYIDTYKPQSEQSITIFAYDQSKTKNDSSLINYPLEHVSGSSQEGNYQLKKDKNVLTKIYQTKSYEYHSAKSISYFNSLMDNTSYQLIELWVLNYEDDQSNDYQNRFDEKKDSTDSTGWKKYDNPLELNYTNNFSTYQQDAGNYVFINENTVIRLIFKPIETTFTSSTQFFDYDISKRVDSKPNNLITSQDGNGVGINSPGNYAANADQDKMLAFGNMNTGIPLNLQDAKFKNEWLINRGHAIDEKPLRNSQEKNYAIFGMLSGINVDASGNRIPVFSDGIYAPDLFGDSDVEGKTAITDSSSLTFNRKGDTFTLSQASIGENSLENLNYFSHPKNGTTVHDHIWTNHFWPLDKGYSDYDVTKNDPKTGGNENYYFVSKNGANYSVANKFTKFPPSDNGTAHNNLFGMRFEVDFEVDGAYEGPLDYFFFGDDDLWVFVDDHLVADLGGVKQSRGVYVDLRKSLNIWDTPEKTKHRLTVFYTERGLSGSTCFMEFTLPSVTSVKPSEKTGGFKLSKVTYDNDVNTEFTFNIQLFDENNEPLKDNYGYMIFNEDGTAANGSNKKWIPITNGTDVKLKKNQYIIINFLPLKTKYVITEKLSEGEQTEVTFDPSSGIGSDPPYVYRGTVNTASNSSIVCYNKRFFKLPETGSFGINRFYTAGGLLMLLSLIAAADRIRKRGVDL